MDAKAEKKKHQEQNRPIPKVNGLEATAVSPIMESL